MATYFTPLRRKFGVLTLVTACALMGGWIRSFITEDFIGVADNTVSSVHGEFLWTPEPTGIGIVQFSRKAELASDQDSNPDSNPYLKKRWKWRHLGFGVSQVESPNRYTETTHHFPYWSTILPVTLLSGWLLLGKRRVKKSPESI